jgi:hypothetical protein
MLEIKPAQFDAEIEQRVPDEEISIHGLYGVRFMVSEASGIQLPMFVTALGPRTAPTLDVSGRLVTKRLEPSSLRLNIYDGFFERKDLAQVIQGLGEVALSANSGYLIQIEHTVADTGLPQRALDVLTFGMRQDITPETQEGPQLGDLF